jgi:peptidyl-prolyl isomerase D
MLLFLLRKIKDQSYSCVLYVFFQALKINSKCAKALYRRGQAKRGLNEYEAALKDLRKALSLSRNDKVIRAEISSLKTVMLDYHVKEKIRCEKMFK